MQLCSETGKRIELRHRVDCAPCLKHERHQLMTVLRIVGWLCTSGKGSLKFNGKFISYFYLLLLSFIFFAAFIPLSPFLPLFRSNLFHLPMLRFTSQENNRKSKSCCALCYSTVGIKLILSVNDRYLCSYKMSGYAVKYRFCVIRRTNSGLQWSHNLTGSLITTDWLA